ncbi:MAG TPA: sialate O-acetylesterase [Pirellulales bacterium]|nr:sialate O-acetylesterase [Pirellulales bacterium]
MTSRTLRILSVGLMWSFVFSVSNVRGGVKLPAIFSDHMVVQAEVPIPVWGWADPGEKVTVSLGGSSQTTKADADGKWKVTLGKLKSGDNAQTLTAQGTNTLSIKDVLVGEVWLASGQSNMAFDVARGKDAESEIAAADHPQIRMFKVTSNPQATPQADCTGSWQVCSPTSVSTFSAVAYFFGRDLQQRLKVPVGMINSSVGGTDIAAWTSAEAQSPNPDLKAGMDRWDANDKAYDPKAAKATYDKQVAAWKEKVKKAKDAGEPVPKGPRLQGQPRNDPNRPCNLYNGMIEPLIPYAIRGAIWYQGEHNCSSEEKARLYAVQLPLLVQDWRTRWGYDFPFAWVQLPNFIQTAYRPLVREAMLKSLSVKDTGMAVTIDVGEANDNHPKNKQEVGHRLALWALGTVYHQKVSATSGPLLSGQPAKHGDAMAITFDHAEGGLVAKGGALKGFVIAGKDREWKPAHAKIDGDTVVVSSPTVTQPVAVRYAWDSNPDGNLFNRAGLPASPFRTDDW